MVVVDDAVHAAKPTDRKNAPMLQKKEFHPSGCGGSLGILECLWSSISLYHDKLGWPPRTRCVYTDLGVLVSLCRQELEAGSKGRHSSNRAIDRLQDGDFLVFVFDFITPKI